MGTEIATCGHAVKQGLTYSREGITREFEPCEDYGNWCAKCTLEFYEHDEKKILNSEINKLCEEIIKLRRLNESHNILH